jgi:MSHA biogenesis protein MshI
MAQQLNLFDPSLRPEVQWLTPGRLLVGLLLLLALMAGAAQWLKWDAAHIRAQAQGDEVQLRQLAQAQQQSAVQADAELPRLREQLAEARLITQALRPQDDTPPDQAARVLAALSGAALQGSWIELAQWQSQPRQLALEGGLLQGDLLPAYLRRLEREPAFNGQRFAQVQLQPAESAGALPYHRFVLRSQPREGGR